MSSLKETVINKEINNIDWLESNDNINFNSSDFIIICLTDEENYYHDINNYYPETDYDTIICDGCYYHNNDYIDFSGIIYLINK